MTRSGKELLEHALKLSQPERARLAHELFDSLDDEHQGDLEIDPGYLRELDRRALDEPKPGERWPTAREVVDQIRRRRRKSDLTRPSRRPSKKRA